MLFDPKWHKYKPTTEQAKPSLAGFVAWLETKDPKEKYNFWDTAGRCAVDQYFTSIGIGQLTRSSDHALFIMWGELNDVAYTSTPTTPFTFGKLLKHARSLLRYEV